MQEPFFALNSIWFEVAVFPLALEIADVHIIRCLSVYQYSYFIVDERQTDGLFVS